MADKVVYECNNCGRKIEERRPDAAIPECCSKPMTKAVPLPVCSLSETAEHSRMEEMGEPCDDGRAGTLDS
jgi:DNA-directed RNA polymerase subunit RPC12/RpoP